MDPWDDNVVAALQSCTVMVCVSTVRYFNREVCGKEYRLFDLKRKQRLPDGQDPPPVILPVVWAPCELPPFMQALQLVPKEVSDSYLEKGLRHFARFDRDSYHRCNEAFATSIVKTWKKHKSIKPLDKVPDFENIPNAFAAGKWEEALGPDGGFLAGPEVANFIFAAESRDECPQPAGRYGTTGSEWRPFFPIEPETALDHAAKGLKKRFRFREIRLGETFRSDLEQAKKRKNLSIMIGEPRGARARILQRGKRLPGFVVGGILRAPALSPKRGQVQRPVCGFPVEIPRDLPGCPQPAHSRRAAGLA